MADIKLKFHPSLVSGKKGTVFLEFEHNRIFRYVSTEVNVYSYEWDEAARCLYPYAQNYTRIQNYLDLCIRNVYDIIKNIKRCNVNYTVEDMVTAFRKFDKNRFFLAFAFEQSCILQSQGRMSTALNYRRAIRSFSSFLQGHDVPIALIDGNLINGYSKYLTERGLMRNSISFYMRILRSIYNRAVSGQLTEQASPFSNVYTGIDKTSKRAVSEKVIYELYRLKLPRFSMIDMSRDLFMFSYCTRGMPFVDIVNLKKTNIHDSVICYSRHKTNQRLMVRIEKEARRLIDKYSYFTSNSPYVFPILTGEDNVLDFSIYQKALNDHNRMLKKLSQMLSTPCHLTSYVARHSWATAAQTHNIPISVISQGLGHSSESTTRIYLAHLENNIIDMANLEIIKALR